MQQGNNEISFLLNFDFQNAGAKEAEDFLTRFIAYFGELDESVAGSSSVIDKYNQKLSELVAVKKLLGEQTSKETGVNKESALAIQMVFSECVRLKKEYDEVNFSKKNLTKTTEELNGELKRAQDQVKNLSGKLLDMKVAGNQLTPAYTELTKSLNTYKNIVINTRVELDGQKASQEQMNGVISATRERIKELNLVLDTFTTKEELASEAAQVYKSELNDLNSLLKILQKETSGVNTIETALAVTRQNNIKMQNELNVIQERDIELKAQLIVKEEQQKVAIADKVSQIKTGYTLEEEAILKKLILEEESFEKSWLLGQQWLAKQEEIFNKAWRAGEDYQIKKQRGEQESFDKAWKTGEEWLAKQEEIFNKAWRAGEDYQIKQQQIFDKAWREGENWQIKQAQAAEEAEARKQKAIEKTTVMYRLQQFVVRDLFRLVASMLTIMPLMALINFVVDFTKSLLGFGDATVKAREDIVKFNVAFADASFEIIKNSQLEAENLKILIDRSKDLNVSYEERANAIKKVRDAYGDLLDKYDDIQIAESKEAKDAMKKSQRLKEERDIAKATYEATLKDITENEKKIENAKQEKAQNSKNWMRSIFNPGENDFSQNKAIKIFQDQIAVDKGVLNTRKNAYENAEKASEDFDHPFNNELRIKTFKRLLDEAERKNEVVDYSKYGLTKDSSMEDVKNMKENNEQYKSDTAEVIQTIRRLKDTIKELEGKKDKNPSVKKGVSPLMQELKTERDRTADTQSYLTKEHQDNAPYNTYEDDIRYHEKQKEEAIKHYEEMIAIRNKYEGTLWQTKEKYKQITIEADKERLNSENAANKAEQEIFEEKRKRYNQELKNIEDFNRKVAKSNRDLEIEINKHEASIKKSASNLKAAKKVNPLLALFGVSDSKSDFDLDQENLQSDIDQKQSDKTELQRGLFTAQHNAGLTRQWLDSNSGGQTDEGAVANDKSGQFKIQLDELRKYKDEEAAIKKQLEEKSISLDDSIAKKEILNEKRKADAKREFAQKGFEFAQGIANKEFDLQKNRIENQMQLSQQSYAFEIELAGNNSAGKQKLQQQQIAEMKKLKREEAKIEKEQAIFSALLNTAKGVTEVIGKYGVTPVSLPLIAITSALGLSEVAYLSARALPSYWKGRKGGKAETARLNELGPELVEDKQGKFKVFGDGKETIAGLEDGDIVHTHEESKRLAASSALISDIMKQKENKKSETLYIGLTPKDLKEALKEMKQPVIQLPADAVSKLWHSQSLRNGTF